jgi:anti-sigma regulatory factor (Ser/Thr protein kinase)
MSTIRLRIPSEPLAPRIARRALQQLGDEVPPQRLADLGLLVSELVTNCVRYAAPSEIDLRVDVDGAALRVEVRDEGPGIPREDARATMPAPVVSRGRGLALVASVAENWGIGAGPGGYVWFTMRLGGRRS